MLTGIWFPVLSLNSSRNAFGTTDVVIDAGPLVREISYLLGTTHSKPIIVRTGNTQEYSAGFVAFRSLTTEAEGSAEIVICGIPRSMLVGAKYIQVNMDVDSTYQRLLGFTFLFGEPEIEQWKDLEEFLQ